VVIYISRCSWAKISCHCSNPPASSSQVKALAILICTISTSAISFSILSCSHLTHSLCWSLFIAPGSLIAHANVHLTINLCSALSTHFISTQVYYVYGEGNLSYPCTSIRVWSLLSLKRRWHKRARIPSQGCANRRNVQRNFLSHFFLFVVFFINDVPLIRARVPSVLWFIIGFLLFHSPLGLIHNSSFLNIQSDVTRIFPTSTLLSPIPSSSELPNLDFMANRAEVMNQNGAEVGMHTYWCIFPAINDSTLGDSVSH